MLFEYLPTLFSNDRYAKVKAEAIQFFGVANFDIFSDGYTIFLLQSNIATFTFQSQTYEIPFTYNNEDFLPLYLCLLPLLQHQTTTKNL